MMRDKCGVNLGGDDNDNDDDDNDDDDDDDDDDDIKAIKYGKIIYKKLMTVK